MSEDRSQIAKLPERRGLICPRCECTDLRVVYTRHRVGFVLRRRECRNCGRRIVTRERAG